MLSRLRSLTEADVTSGNAMHETMLAAMCRWGRGTDILDLVSSWLSAAFDGGEGSSTTSNTQVYLQSQAAQCFITEQFHRQHIKFQ